MFISLSSKILDREGWGFAWTIQLLTRKLSTKNLESPTKWLNQGGKVVIQNSETSSSAVQDAVENNHASKNNLHSPN